MLKVYTKAPRPTLRVIFFAPGRFRRMRDGVFADDPEQMRDPDTVLTVETKYEDDMPFLGDAFRIRDTETVIRLTENGQTLAEGTRITQLNSKRRHGLDVYVLR